MVVEHERSGKVSPHRVGIVTRLGNGLAGSSGWGVIAYGVIGVLLFLGWVITLGVMAGEKTISSGVMGSWDRHLHFGMMLVVLFCIWILVTAFIVSCLAYVFRTSFIRWVTENIGANHGLSCFVAGSILIAVEAMPYGDGLSTPAAVVISLIGLMGVLCLGLGYRILWQRAGDVEQRGGPLLTGGGRLSQGLESALTGQRLWGPLLFLCWQY